MQKTVLITGSAGFTGRYMTREMKQAGYHVVGVGSHPALPETTTAGNASSGETYPPVDTYIQADLADLSALTHAMQQWQPDAVMHLAGIANVGHGSANDFYQVNLMGARNLLQAIADSGKIPDRILMASSANIYGNASEGSLSETTPPAPANDYAVSKLAMEYMARLWMDRLPIVITRPFNYSGIGQTEHFLLPKIVSHFQRRAEIIELGNLDVYRDFSDVRAVAQVYRKLVDHATPATGSTVNVCSGQARSLREVIGLCSAITGHSIDIQVNPAFVRASEVKTLYGDASLLKSLIGEWHTPPLEDTLRWMLENRPAGQIR